MSKMLRSRWIELRWPDTPMDTLWECPQCERTLDFLTDDETPLDRHFHYCPFCGAQVIAEGKE